MKPRDPYFDNLKCLLIYLVVAGHFLLPLLELKLLNHVFQYIYVFHMPCFAFISGCFAKSAGSNGRFRPDRPLTLLWLYLFFKILVYPTENLAAGGSWAAFSLFTESGAPWYLLALAIWYITLPLVSRLKPWLTITIALLIGLLSGYSHSIHYFLALNRVFAFAPFFYTGYYVSKDAVRKTITFTEKVFCILLFIPASGLVLHGASTYLERFSPIVYGIRYSYMGSISPYGALVRMAWYILATVLMLGIMAIIPARECIFSKIGARSLQIYIMHRPIRDLCQYFGLFRYPSLTPAHWLAVILLGCAALTAILAAPQLTKFFDFIGSLPIQLLRYTAKNN